MFGRWRILQGDCRAVLRTLPKRSVQTVVTSPPYWGLRDYGVDGQLGLELTPKEYVTNLVKVFRAVRRVLRDDGTVWLNLGDSYATTGGHADTACRDRRGSYNIGNRPEHDRRDFRARPVGKLKQKDLVGIPWRVAFALQDDGWYLRSDIIWNKPNAMPESVTDRPTRSHEYLFLLSKSADYYYDHEAIKEAAVETESGNDVRKFRGEHGGVTDDRHRSNQGFSVPWTGTTRNKRTVWTIPTEPFADAHFATFPTELVRPCILAGTSRIGCCAKCGAPHRRIVERTEPVDDRGTRRKRAGVLRNVGATSAFLTGEHQATRTIAWEPTCTCEHGPGYAPPVPCTVLDPFSGAGTTGVVATRVGREFLGVELKGEYAKMAERRIQGDAPLFNVAGRA